MAKPFKLLVLPGDGIGPEVMATALSVLERLCRLEGIETEIQNDLLHGAAPDIAGQGIANPIGTVLSAALMFEYSLQRKDLAHRIDDAVEQCLEAGVLTADLGGSGSTQQVCEKILSALN